MRLPVPYTFGGHTWSEASVGRITGGAIADAQAAAESEDYFKAILALLSHVVTEMSDGNGGAETDRAQVKNLLREMPTIDAEYLAVQALAISGDGDNDWIEGVYPCPRCGHQLIIEGEVADRVRDLETSYGDADERVQVRLAQPVKIVSQRTGEVIVAVSSVDMRQPTVRDYIRAFSKVGAKDQLRYQYAAYSEALELVNDEKVDERWRATWGPMIFESMDSTDLSAIGMKIREHGLMTRVPRTCPKCGKRWDAEVSTEGFFASRVLPRR